MKFYNDLVLQASDIYKDKLDTNIQDENCIEIHVYTKQKVIQLLCKKLSNKAKHDFISKYKQQHTFMLLVFRACFYVQKYECIMYSKMTNYSNKAIIHIRIMNYKINEIAIFAM